jgi:chemotaxis protein methyltransferase CheR
VDSRGDLALFRNLVRQMTGVHMTEAKDTLVLNRLAKRLRELNIDSYQDYYNYAVHPGNRAELSMVVDLLTTHETHFFREPEHFQIFENHLKRCDSKNVRVWSAACSTGEEVWTIAMVLMNYYKTTSWLVEGSDISPGSVQKAWEGIYPISETNSIPTKYLKLWCRKGVGTKSGFFSIGPELRPGVKFFVDNILETTRKYESMDVIFLRNVLIYFDPETKEKAIRNAAKILKKGGLLFLGHSEAISFPVKDLESRGRSVYYKR